jgi:hypothetical protein
MGRNVTAKIVYGYELGEVSLPWDTYSEDPWWRKIKGFKPSVVIYDENDDYINGIRPPQELIDLYFKERKDWEKANPLPIEVINAGGGEFIYTVIALRSPIVRAEWGSPQDFDFQKIMNDVNDYDRDTMIKFCKEYLAPFKDLDVEVDWDNPKWLLCAYSD